jgi:hypothetical protein
MTTNKVMRSKFDIGFARTCLAAIAAVLVVLANFSSSTASAKIDSQATSTISTPAKGSLQSKYAYFKKNNTVVIKAILQTRCKPNGYSFKWREGAEIWVSQTKKYSQGGLSMYPVVAYRKATSSTGQFQIVAAGESQLWWTKKWGCPVSGAWNTYGTKVTMTTKQLIDAGY